MIEIQCTSCHTRYRIDERVLPDETPTFKCSRCGHVFNAEPVPARPRKPPVARSEKPTAAAPAPEPPVESKAEPTSPAPEPEPPPPPAEKPQTPEENPLDRTFSRERPEDMDAGENLSFDFASESRTGDAETEGVPDQQAHTEDHWEVGDLPEDASVEPRRTVHEISRDPEPEPAARASDAAAMASAREVQRDSPLEGFSAPEFTASHSVAAEERRAPGQRIDIPDEVAYFAARRPARSAGWFLGLFAVVAMLFASLSFAVHVEPAPVARLLSQAPRVGSNFQRPMLPAMLVALHDVHADYEQIKGGQTALLISGTAENVGSAPLHAVLLAVDLLDNAGKQVASNAAYCGNGLTTKMVGEMTPREIEFLQRLDPQKNFAVEPARTAPFLLVFIDPPPKIANLRIQVAKAVAVQGAPTPRS
jgi:predicted Zn finger-like uncharacterized protein